MEQPFVQVVALLETAGALYDLHGFVAQIGLWPDFPFPQTHLSYGHSEVVPAFRTVLQRF